MRVKGGECGFRPSAARYVCLVKSVRRIGRETLLVKGFDQDYCARRCVQHGLYGHVYQGSRGSRREGPEKDEYQSQWQYGYFAGVEIYLT